MGSSLQTQVMGYLSERLSATLADLVEVLEEPQEEVQKALQSLEKEQLIHRAKDTVTGQDFYSPTSRGILKARQQFHSAF